MLNELPKSNKWETQNATGGNLTTSKQKAVKELGISHPERYQQLAKHQDIVAQAQRQEGKAD